VPNLLDSDLGDPPFISVKNKGAYRNKKRTARMRYDKIVANFVTHTHSMDKLIGN
jgi:hypothetical protein